MGDNSDTSAERIKSVNRVIASHLKELEISKLFENKNHSRYSRLAENNAESSMICFNSDNLCPSYMSIC